MAIRIRDRGENACRRIRCGDCDEQRIVPGSCVSVCQSLLAASIQVHSRVMKCSYKKTKEQQTVGTNSGGE